MVAPATALVAPDLDVGVEAAAVEDRDVARTIAYDELAPVRPPHELVLRRIFEFVGRVGLASEKTPPYSRGRQTAYRRTPAHSGLKVSGDGRTKFRTVRMSLAARTGEHAKARWVRRPARHGREGVLVSLESGVRDATRYVQRLSPMTRSKIPRGYRFLKRRTTAAKRTRTLISPAPDQLRPSPHQPHQAASKTPTTM
jgi:hypothetical protein